MTKKLLAMSFLWLSACLLLAVACTCSAQTLARPGWTASGFTADPWWKHAVFYEVKQPIGAIAYVGPAPPSPMDWVNSPKTIAVKLDALQSLGVDALILPMPDKQTSQAAMDNFDELVRQASPRGVHILLRFPVFGSSADLTATARLWLSRGVSGFYVPTPAQAIPTDSQTIVAMLRKIESTAVGGRIVIADLAVDASGGSGRRGRSGDLTDAQLQVDARDTLPSVPEAASLRRVLEAEPSEPTVLVDLPQPADSPDAANPDASAWKAIAALALTTHPVALIDADAQLSGSNDAASATLADWYRKLIALHHGNATLRYGSATPLDFDAENALVWVSRASAGTGQAAPIVVACNLSSAPIHLALGSAVRALNLHGSFLLTLLRTDSGMGPQDLNSVMVPAYGVYIGELHR
jgi:glycosidase